MPPLQSPPLKLPSDPRLVFMGTPDFAVPSLKTLLEKGYKIVAVVTQPDRSKGRGRKVVPPPVKVVAEAANLEVLQPENASDEGFCSIIKGLEPDIIIVVAFGQILKARLLGIPKWGALNIHASLLPKYRGAAPIHWAILNGETETGLTAMVMDEGLDTGPIVSQKKVPIEEGDTGGSLHDRLSVLAGEFLCETLLGLIKGELEPRPQDDSQATYAPKIIPEMAQIEWSEPAERVVAKIKAFDPWPGAYSFLRGKKIKLFSGRVSNERTENANPGLVLDERGGKIIVATGKGAVEIGEIQVPGKRRMSIQSFLAGNKLPQGSRFGLQHQ